MKAYNFWVYILTNKTRTMVYTGITNDLSRRLQEHHKHRGRKKTFTGRYNCHYLVYYEWHKYVLNAIAREKEIKNFTPGEEKSIDCRKHPGLELL